MDLDDLNEKQQRRVARLRNEHPSASNETLSELVAGDEDDNELSELIDPYIG